jgi:hypothetical protein
MKPSILPQMGTFRAFTSVAITLLACHVRSSARGQIINGGFETGNPAGWSFAGQATAKDASFGVIPTHGLYAGFLDNTGNGTVLAGQMETALHLSTGTVTNIVLGVPTRGTVIFQDVAVSAGQQLVFDWNFMSDELNEDPVFNDYCFYSVVGNTSGVTNIFLLASRNSSTFPGTAPAGYDGLTGWFTTTYTFSANDTYRVGFGVMNVTDSGHDSAMMLDGVVVPEPGTISLGLLGAVCGVVRMRSRRRA